MRPAGLALVAVASAAVALAVFLALGRAEPAPEPESPPPDSETAFEVPRPANMERVDPLVVESLREAIGRAAAEPENGRLIGELGLLYEANEFHDLARACYERAAELDAGTADWFYYLGVAAVERGRLDEGVRNLERSLALEPGYPAAHYYLGEARLARGELDEAEAAFEEYSEMEPDEPWSHLGLGRVRFREERYGEAAEELERALELLPGERRATYLLAMTYRRMGRDVEAKALLARHVPDVGSPAAGPPDPRREALRSRSAGLQALVQRANRRLSSGDLAAAEELYRQVLEHAPDHYTALVNLGNVLGRQRQTAEALAVLRRAVEVDPDNPHGHYGLALALLSQGQRRAAEAELREVLRLDPEHPHAGSMLARLQGR